MEANDLQANAFFSGFGNRKKSVLFVHFWSSIRRMNWLRYWLMQGALPKEATIILSMCFPSLQYGLLLFLLGQFTSMKPMSILSLGAESLVAAVEYLSDSHYAFFTSFNHSGMG